MIFNKLHELQGKVIGLTASSFDLLHAGHITMLAEAKTHCDYLIAALQVDPTVDRPEKNLPAQSIIERQIQLGAVRYVDEVIVYHTEQDLENLLRILPIHKRILGVEYQDREFTGRQICIDRGISLVYNSRPHNLSSSELRRRIHQIESSQR
jgi:glycerol-3-phosphate cytidylyltransferase